MRKLLPYEHQLVEALGISEEEYLEFVAVQQEYKDAKVGTAFDTRNVATGTAALVLTVVGILFQVGAALLAPKPEVPDIKDRQRRNREQRFAPTFGFNSTQELASYGDPVNLVYTNQNDNGNVRVAGSLVWSAVENFGSTQFMQLMVVLGASQIKLIDYTKTAFGQLPMKDLNTQTVFIFGKEDGVAGVPLFGEIKDTDFGSKDFFPTSLKPGDQRPACLVVRYGSAGEKKLGFSQAYTPTTSTSLGVFDAVPINVDVKARNDKGKERTAPINITMPNNLGNNSVWVSRTSQSASFDVGETIVLKFNDAKAKDGDKEARSAAVDLRRQTLEALDFGSTYMLGTAKFRLTGHNTSDTNIEQDEVFPIFKCIESGHTPTADYDRVEPRIEASGTKEELETAQEILRNDPVTDEEGIEDRSTLPRSEAVIATDDELGINIVFRGTQNVSWENPYTGNESVEISRRGSIAFTEREQKKALANPPVINDKQARNALADRVDELQLLISNIDGGDYDLDPGKYEEGVGDLPAGRVEDSKVNFHRIKSGDVLIGYDADYVKQYSLSVNQRVPYSLHYISENGTNYYFWFTGVTRQKTNTDDPKFFPDDKKLNDLRTDLSDAIRVKDEETSGADNLDQKYTNITNEAKRPDQTEADVTGRNKVLNRDSELEIYKYVDDRIGDQDEEINELRRRINERVAKLLNSQKKPARRIIKSDIKTLKQRRENIPPGEDIPDAAGALAIGTAYEQLIQEKQDALLNINAILGDWETYVKGLDNNFFLKCLTKAESASYDTLSPCNSVKFSLKSRLSRRISGRQRKYAEQPVKEYSASDNGIKSRMAFFRVFFKKNTDKSFVLVPVLFAIRRGSDADFYTQLNFYSSTQSKWQFKFEPVFDLRAENLTRGFSSFAMIENTKNTAEITESGAVFSWFGKTVAKNTNTQFPDEQERGPALTNEWDMFSVNSDTQVQFSFESGPEILLTAVTEQQADSSYNNKYSNMTMMALGVFAGRGIQDLRSISALVTHGKLCRTVENPNAATASSSYAPDIFVDTVLDKENGIGKYVDVISVDTASLQQAKNFCIGNNLPRQEGGSAINLFMDGMIADVGSWREFWINVAPFSLLELARKNGKDTLVPALPCNGSGEAADNNGLPIGFNVSALFTAGNILEGSYKEEHLNYGTATEDIIASVIYRKYNANEVFSTKESVDVSLKNPSGTAIRETFDLSQFVTQKEQAIMFGKLLCNQRRYIRKGIEFQTFPSEAVIAPGDFIYVDVGMEDWDKYSAGVIMDGGSLNSPLLDARPNGTYQFLVYKGQTGETQSFSSVSVSNGVASGLSGYTGWMFVMGTQKPQKRVYRVTELAIEEEGEVSVKALEYPCFESGGQLRARIADFRKRHFDVS
jgi:hypothetical protein